MLKISEFSKLSHLTIKALRYYEKEGLLKPVHIDEWSNYRFYDTFQLETAARIKSFRQLDLSVEEIKAIGKENDHIKFKTLPESKVLSIYHKGSYANIGEAYAFLMKYADQNGYTVAGLARECYIDGIWNKESEEKWLTEIQLPIEDVTK